MDLYLPSSILTQVYNYMSWYDLLQMRNVPNYTWERWYNYLCQDIHFKCSLMAYWAKDGYSMVPHKERLLFFLVYCVKYSHTHWIPDILFKDDVFMSLILQYRAHEVFMDDTHAWIRLNRKWCLIGVMHDGLVLKYVDSIYKKDKEIVLTATKQYWNAFYFADEKLKDDDEMVLEAVEENGLILGYVGDSMRKNRNVVLKAIEKNGAALLYADVTLRADKEIVLKAVKSNPEAITFIDIGLITDREVVLEFIRSSVSRRNIIAEGDDILIVSRDVMTEAVDICWAAFVLSTEDMKTDKEFVLDIVKRNGLTIIFAGDSLKNDPEILAMASKQLNNSETMTYRDIVLLAVKEDGWILEYCDNILNKDKEIVLTAGKNWQYVFDYIDDELRKDKEVMLEAVKNWQAYEWWNLCPFVNDMEFMMHAVKYDETAVKYITDIAWKSDRGLVLAAINKSKDMLWEIDESLTSDADFMLEVIKSTTNEVYCCRENLRSNPDFIFEAFKRNISIMRYVAHDILNRDFLLKLIKQKGDMVFNAASVAQQRVNFPIYAFYPSILI